MPLADLVRGVAADVDFEANGRGRSVKLDIGELGTSSLMGRPELLRRAVENVLRNARALCARRQPGRVPGAENAEGGGLRVVMRFPTASA